MTNTKLLFAAILIMQSGLAFAEQSPHRSTHTKVQAALDYNIPLNSCKKPKTFGKMTSVIDSEGQGAITQSDVDSYTMKRLKRKEKRWQSCVEKYKKELLKDLAELRNSAQYGLTQEQANIILGKMADIQSVVMSANAIKPADPDNP